MSHDRGCYRCFQDRPYDGCPISNCPNRPHGGWPDKRPAHVGRYWKAAVLGPLWIWHDDYKAPPKAVETWQP